MSAEIPSRPPFRPDEQEAFRREHAHTAERDGDAMAPVYVHRTLSARDKERRSLRSVLPSPADLPDPDAPVGEVIDVVPGALVRRPGFVSSAERSSSQAGLQAMRYALGATHRAISGAQGAPQVDDREVRNSIVELDAREEGRIQGERAGKVAGLDIAKQITDEVKAEIFAEGDPMDGDYIRSVLDDLAVRFVERAAKEGS